MYAWLFQVEGEQKKVNVYHKNQSYFSIKKQVELTSHPPELDSWILLFLNWPQKIDLSSQYHLLCTDSKT